VFPVKYGLYLWILFRKKSFLGPRANVELVPKFRVALHASHAALPMVK
jgi:hypothetical protein